MSIHPSGTPPSEVEFETSDLETEWILASEIGIPIERQISPSGEI